MKRREQALLWPEKAAQDESLPDAVMDVDTVADEVFGFHCQQAAEKIIKALLSDAGMAFQKTHNIAALMETLAGAGLRLPDSFDAFQKKTQTTSRRDIEIARRRFGQISRGGK